MTSYVSLNVVESETFQNKRNEEVGLRNFYHMKADFDVEKKVERKDKHLSSFFKSYVFILQK